LGGFLVAFPGAHIHRLGGPLRLQGIALLIGIAAPFLLGANWVFQTVTFDQVTWMLSLYWFLCLVIGSLRKATTSPVYPIDGTLAKCDPFGYSINVTLDGCCDHRAIPRTKTCIVTRSRTSTRPMPFSLAG
jgi:hypothetical protein